VKVLSLISTVLLALSLAGAAPAQAAAPAANHIAPATIELAQCDADSPAPCGINARESKAAEVDLHALPPADPKQQQAADPATPVPEPQTFVMLMLGLVVLGFTSRRRTSEKFKG
jgi:uncharacterized protein involved in copper resistance